MIEIRVTGGDEESKVHTFETLPIRLGRGADNDLVLTSKTCSRNHAEIVQEGDRVRMVDRGSANGLLVGTERLTEVDLKDGMKVGIGDYTLTVSLPDDASESTVVLPAASPASQATVVMSRAKGAAPAPQPKQEPAEPPVLYLLYSRQKQEQSLKVAYGVEYVIGRAPDADVVVDDKKSSARHAQVFSRDGRFFVRDLDSSNGTIVDGKKKQEAELTPGTRIVVGDTEILAIKERKELSDEAVLLDQTMMGSVARRPDPAPRRRGAPPPSQKKGAGILVTLAAVAGLGLVAAAAAFFLLREGTGDGPDAGTGDPPPQPALVVEVATVESKEMTRSVDGTGTVAAGQRVTVGVEVPGRIIALPVEEGSMVEQGQLLAQLNDRDIRLQIDEARSAISQEQVDVARQDYERQERLFQDGVVTRSVLDQTKQHYLSLDSAYNSAQAKIRQLREQLTKTKVTAPISGRVAQKLVNQGEFVGPGSPLVVLDNVEEVLVELEVPDRDIVQIEKGQPVEATIDAFPDRTFHGLVDMMASAAHPVTRTFQVQARIGNHDGVLRAGMIASLRIVLDRTKALVVPEDALMDRDGDQATVFVVGEDRKVRKTPVRLGEAFDREIELREGLSEGDDVVVFGKEQVVDGQSIDSYERR